jgi:predicted unusual protein kinase regulating ubiquinone biosynthesis (AarF/ABC1/UbiB family)
MKVLRKFFKYIKLFFNSTILLCKLRHLKRVGKAIEQHQVNAIKHAAKQCGPIGIKFLQFLMLNDNFMSKHVIGLFDDVYEMCDKHSWHQTQELYENDFGHSIERDYGEKCESIASGSIGQVYKIYNTKLSKYVAMKVKHPNVDVHVFDFVRTIRLVTRFVSLFMEIPFKILIHEYMDNVQLQLDYKTEANNLVRLRDNFSNTPHIIVPNVYEVTKNFIIMSFCDGVQFTDIKNVQFQRKISIDVMLFMTASLLIYDFIHCDFHKGNWKVQYDTNDVDHEINYKIVIYDCGLFSSIGNKHMVRDVLSTFYDGEFDRMVNLLSPDRINIQPRQLEKRNQVQKFAKETMNSVIVTSSDRFKIILSEVIRVGLEIDRNVLRSLQALAIASQILEIGVSRITNIIYGKHGPIIHGLVMCTYHGMTKYMDKYPELYVYLSEWIREDQAALLNYKQWMMEEFGHDDEEVYLDVITQAMGIKKPVHLAT